MRTIVIILICLCTVNAQRPLQKYKVDRLSITTSGASSGAAMATQLHVAYSSLIKGAAVLAGGPYYCSQGSATNALSCMNNPDEVIISELVAATNDYASSGDIDLTSNMFNSRVYVYAGTIDRVVDPGMGPKTEEYYRNYVDSNNFMTVFDIEAEHTYPTMDYGIPCNELGSPYIGKCNYYAAYELLNHMYPGLTRPIGTVPLNGDFYEFDQTVFFLGSTPSDASMDDIGYVYVPSGCMSLENVCRLHVVFHGCNQGRHRLEDEFVLNTGYNEVGELNNIIILYPQATAVLVNPQGCWDWWGYTDFRYATKQGLQPLAVKNMIDQVS